MSSAPGRIVRLRQNLDDLRARARQLQATGARGLQIATFISNRLDEFLVQLMDEALQEAPANARTLSQSAALVAVGGSGRGDTAPYSDVDLLFLSSDAAAGAFAPLVAHFVRDAWDAGLKLGHSVRTLKDTLRMAREDTQFATSLVNVRGLWGNQDLVATMSRQFQRQVQRRAKQFVENCIQSRELERSQRGEAVLQLEPDLKRSFGGLRDLHLIRWVGFARYGVSQIDALQLRGAFTSDEARRLILAYEYLTSIRVNLHLAANRENDLLSRDEQLRITQERGITGTAGLRPVECFMRDYFEHSLTIADLSSRFTSRDRRHPWLSRAVNYAMSFRVDDIYCITATSVSVIRRAREATCSSVENVLRLYFMASLHCVMPADDLIDEIRERARTWTDAPLSAEASHLFLRLLARPGYLGTLLRSLYDIGILELVLPALRHTRCLLQFNQYHSYTVDEHTLRSIAAAESFDHAENAVGRAYREIHHKELLHLALLLHDAGKGYEEDHSDVGRRLAIEAAERLQLPEHQRDLLIFLVYRHLLMATLAFRRDISDAEVLLKFSHEVGSPDALQMLYVLTAADITAVGPGVWNDWKAELLTSLYDSTMEWLSGKSHQFSEQRRLENVLSSVLKLSAEHQLESTWVRNRLQHAPSHYLLSMSAQQIASDLAVICARQPDDIAVEGVYDEETLTVQYRVITSEEVGVGFFHKLTGVLSAKRMEILNAQICTYSDGIIIDRFRVRDYDHEGSVPAFRIEEVQRLIERALRGEIDVDRLFESRLRFSPHVPQGPVSDLPFRAVIDNETSDRCTVIDIFAHDRPGLLYRIARTLFELDLSLVLAKISTHFDQVVDVFYVTDARGRKISDGHRLRTIRQVLTQQIEQFEKSATDSVPARLV